MYKRKLVIPTERSDEGSQKYRKIRDLSRTFEMTKYANFFINSYIEFTLNIRLNKLI